MESKKNEAQAVENAEPVKAVNNAEYAATIDPVAGVMRDNAEKTVSSNENDAVKTLRKSWIMAIVGLLLFLVSATGVTYAWFTLSGRAQTNVTPMGGTVSDGDTLLLISNAESGPFDKECDLVFAGDAQALKPVSTADLENFYRVTLQNKEGVAVSYENANDRVDTDTLHGTVYLRCEGAPCNVYLNREELQLGSDAQALAAMRLGMKITSHEGTQTFVMRLDDLGNTGAAQENLTVPTAGTVVSGISGSGNASYVADPAVNISDYMAQAAGNDEYTAGANILLSLNADEVATVEYWLYLEGCDEQCVNEVQNINSDIRLSFAGVRSDVVR